MTLQSVTVTFSGLDIHNKSILCITLFNIIQIPNNILNIMYLYYVYHYVLIF